MTGYQHKQGVILVNLGTPEESTPSAVRGFLKDFLSDPRVVEIPRLVWLPILYGLILPFRSKRVAKLYADIWLPEGSPLRVYLQGQTLALQKKMDARKGEGKVTVTNAMVYGSPSIKERIELLQAKGVEKILLLPLYPQYSATTTASVYDQCASLMQESRDVADVVVNKSYYRHPDYLQALANSVQEHWGVSGKGQKLLLSFHGIPQRCVDKGDPYYHQCVETADLLAEKLNLKPDDWAFSFQSRLGKAQWLQPYTDKLLTEWGKGGVKSVDVICPAFSADCLETLEEIKCENRDLFLGAGGETFQYIDCLNDRDDHIEMMANIVGENFP